MKRQIKKASLVSILFVSMATAAFAGRGEKAGNGGSEMRLRFFALAQVVHNIVERNSSEFPEIEPQKLLKTISKVKVLFEHDVLNIGNQSVDAMNFPDENKIVFNLIRWQTLDSNPTQKLALIFHELLGVMQINDGNYFVSSRVLNLYTPDDSPSFWRSTCAFYCSKMSQLWVGKDEVSRSGINDQGIRIWTNSEEVSLDYQHYAIGLGHNQAEAFKNAENSCRNWLQENASSAPFHPGITGLGYSARINPATGEVYQKWDTKEVPLETIQPVFFVSRKGSPINKHVFSNLENSCQTNE